MKGQIKYVLRAMGLYRPAAATWRYLGLEKGYSLVGPTSHELNAFFMRSDIGQEMLPEVAVSKYLENHIRRGSWHPGRVEEVSRSGEWVEV